MIGITLDTGVLIAMEKQKPRAMMLLRAAKEQRAELFAITPVVTEWWRGRSDRRDDIEVGVTVVPFPTPAAKAAGLVLGKIRRASEASEEPTREAKERVTLTVDAMVMAFAATYGGGLVCTSDVDDLARLNVYFPSVRILSV